jgi:hypothetical protein
MAAELGPFIKEEHTIVGQRRFAGHGDVAPTEQPRIGNGVRRGSTRAHGHEGYVPADVDGNPIDTGGVEPPSARRISTVWLRFTHIAIVQEYSNIC